LLKIFLIASREPLTSALTKIFKFFNVPALILFLSSSFKETLVTSSLLTFIFLSSAKILASFSLLIIKNRSPALAISPQPATITGIPGIAFSIIAPVEENSILIFP
jgi:hypothetical protein